MATNLVSIVMQYLTPDMIGRIASSLGIGRNDTSSAIESAVPTLLAAFVGVATKPGGAQKLADAAKQETGTLGKFAGMIGTAGQTSVTERGSQMLASLLGDRDQTALANAVGKYSGLGSAAGSSVLGVLAPVVMGAIAQQQGPRALDAGSIASLLTSQKDSIAEALPSGFGKYLGGTGVLDTLGEAARRTAAAGSETTRAAASSVVRTIDDTRRSGVAAASNSTNWLLWIIPAVAIAALLIYLLGRPAEQVVQQGVTAVQSSDGRRARYRQTGHRQYRRPAHDARRHHRRGLGASGVAQIAGRHGSDRQGQRVGRSTIGRAKEDARRIGQSRDVDAQSAVRQSAGDPRCGRSHKAHDRQAESETRNIDRLNSDRSTPSTVSTY